MTGAAAASRRYALLILTLIYMVNFIDRQILAVLLQEIKEDFQVSDAALGLLVGPTFAFFYAFLGLPLALLADRVNRRNLIGVSLTFFSLMTILCGMATQFWQLLLARICTGVGEAGTGPASQAMISDLYPPEQRARAQAIYATGVNVGVLIAFAVGGMVGELFGWRAAFLVAGLPGLLLAILMFTTMKDVPRASQCAAEKRHDEVPALPDVLKILWRSKALRFAILGACTTCFTGYAVGGFFPSLLARTQDISLTEIGLTIALIAGVGGGLATYCAGHAADRLSRRDRRWNLYIPALAAFLPIPFAPLGFLSESKAVMLIGAIPALALTAAFIGPTVAVIHKLVPERARATAVAVLILIDSIVGLGFGPQFVGLVSELLRPAFGLDSLRYAMLASIIGSVISVISFLMAAHYFKSE